eukprot:gnl/MRDRNA2_/MRDRNA2_90787_c0_seq1.p1 gnl/MRDRNA2_/MRDRNA2_90787_c0~~gnl/MRDRNA2_/MRDRNA2_90787_c0_seq1.p1  ORF type:complete len:491 (+),score=90.01 gnl/MRDRNA2_/MRDRNA2_90787_c0_seq1:183-1655(+)
MASQEKEKVPPLETGLAVPRDKELVEELSARDQDAEKMEKGEERSCCARSCGCCATCCAASHHVTTTLKDKMKPVIEKSSKLLPAQRMLKVNHRGKVYEYDHEALLTWKSLLATTGTIFFQRRVYLVIPLCLSIALLCASIIYLCVPSARKLDTGRFNDFVTYIKVFIAFMLGLFLNNSFRRWWSAVSSFKKFLTSIKQLMYTLHAINVKEELFSEIERNTICSCYILNEEVHTAQLTDKSLRRERWLRVMNWLVSVQYLTEEEREEIEHDEQTIDHQELGVRTTILWTWIGETMSLVRNEPGVAPPMYVRLLFLCHDCMAQIEELKTNLTVQLPFTYAHMLAVLVHLSNVLLSISCGLSFGSALAEVRSRGDDIEGRDNRKVLGEFYEAWQVMAMQVVMLVIQPLLYQAFLVIAHALCYPYGDEICSMPTETFIQQMHYELDVMKNGKSNHRKRRQEALERQKTLGVGALLVGKKGKGKDEDDEEDDDD